MNYIKLLKSLKSAQLISFLYFLFTVNFVAANTFLCEKLKKDGVIKANVVAVVDGDTLKASTILNERAIDLKVRLVAIDTLESKYRGKSQGFWADEASRFLSQHLPVGASIDITYSGDACDRYYRVLGIVSVNQINLNRELVAQGLAVGYCFNKVTDFCLEIAKTMEQAMEQKRGLHASRFIEYPYDFRARISGKTESPWVTDIRTDERLPFTEKDKIPAPWRLFQTK